MQVRLCAEVTVPSLTVSTDTLLFDTVQCGFCQVATVQLYNHGPVPCEWSIRQEERPKKVHKLQTMMTISNTLIHVLPAHIVHGFLLPQYISPSLTITMRNIGSAVDCQFSRKPIRFYTPVTPTEHTDKIGPEACRKMISVLGITF